MLSHTRWKLFGLLLALAWVGCRSQTDQPAQNTQTPETGAATTPVRVDSAQPVADPKWADHTQGLPFVVGYEEGLAKAKAEEKPAMMFVTTTWCGWCKRLAHENFNDPEVQGLLQNNFVCVIVDGDTEAEAQQKLGATQGYPHIIFLSKSGQKVSECLGYKPIAEFKPIVEAALAQAGG